MDNDIVTPTWRKPAGAIAIVLLILVWVVAIASFSREIGAMPFAVQLVVYLVAGTAWILPLGPLLRWMETGRWRRPPPPQAGEG